MNAKLKTRNIRYNRNWRGHEFRHDFVKIDMWHGCVAVFTKTSGFNVEIPA